MKWYDYVSSFWAGVFLANAVPHFVHGISGKEFTTPFAEHPGVSLSSPLVNILWGGFNLLIGYLLLQGGKLKTDHLPSMVSFFAGIMALGILLSVQLAK